MFGKLLDGNDLVADETIQQKAQLYWAQLGVTPTFHHVLVLCGTSSTLQHYPTA
jgi:hypothetical protein